MPFTYLEGVEDFADLQEVIKTEMDGLKAAKADGVVTPEEIIDLEIAVITKCGALFKKVLAQAKD